MSPIEVTMSGLSIVIPSRNVKNLAPCLDAIAENDPLLRTFVVDDGVDWNEWVCRGLVNEDLARMHVRLVKGAKPFVFAKNVNRGIEAIDNFDDVLLLNDDALLQTGVGFTAMHLLARSRPEYGIISAATNLAGNPAQMRRQGDGLREVGRLPGHSAPVVAFVCVLITRTAIERCGLLDERFTAYGWEDNDYCRRVYLAGLKIGVFDGCYVDHAKLHSTFRGDAYAAGDINAGKNIYFEKWGGL
jgi:GT2 family glycosyltransferase